METNFFSTRNLLKKLSMLALISILITLSLLFYEHFYGAKPKKVVIEIPSSIATGIEVTQMNKKGQLAHRLLSSAAHNYKKQQRSTFEHPVGYYYPANQPPWKFSANNAISLKNNTLIQFIGHVRIHQAGSKNNKEITLTTSKMIVLPQQKIAYNHVLITAHQDGLALTSIGFHADLNKNEVKLLSKTKAKYTQIDN